MILRGPLAGGEADEQARHAQSARAGEVAGAASLRARGPAKAGAARGLWPATRRADGRL